MRRRYGAAGQHEVVRDQHPRDVGDAHPEARHDVGQRQRHDGRVGESESDRQAEQSQRPARGTDTLYGPSAVPLWSFSTPGRERHNRARSRARKAPRASSRQPREEVAPRLRSLAPSVRFRSRDAAPTMKVSHPRRLGYGLRMIVLTKTRVTKEESSASRFATRC